MRLYFDRNFKFGGYSTSAQEMGNEVLNFGISSVMLILMFFLGPISGMIYIKALEENDRLAKKWECRGKKNPYKKSPTSEWVLAYFLLILGAFYWVGIILVIFKG